MKFIKLLFPALLLFSITPFVSAQEIEFKDPVDYNNFLTQEHNEIINKNLEYTTYSVHSEDWQAIEEKRLQLIVQVQSSIQKVKSAPAPEGGQELKQEMVEVLELFKKSYQIEFNEINLLKRESQSSYEAMEKYFQATEQAEKNLESASNKFTEAQKRFAEKNDLLFEGTEVKDDRVSNRIQKINEVNAYHRKIFLENFRVSKKNSEFMDAMQTENAELMEAKRKELLEDAKTSLVKLKEINDFNGDVQYRDAAISISRFFQKMAEEKYSKLVYVVGNKDKLTQEDVTAYNEIINTFNTKLPELVNTFNEANVQLLRNNVPKPTVKTKL